nr:hypothetical protein [Tanacetum cinerariifolium]
KAFFLTQWKFFIHMILHSLSAKRTSWNEFSSAMASALICLSSVRGVAKEAEAQVLAQGDDVQEPAAKEVATDGRMIVDMDKDEGIELVIDQEKDAETPKVKDKGKEILIEAPKPIKKKDQIEMDAEYARNLQE